MNTLAQLPEVFPGDSGAALRNLMGLMALPALWAGKGEKAILQLMAEAVGGIVPVEVIYAQVQLPPSHERVEVLRVRTGALEERIAPEWQEFGRACSGQTVRTALTPSPIGALRVVRFYMGAGTKGESICFGSRDPAFPSLTETAMLHAAVSLVTTGLNTARIDYERNKANQRKDEFLAMLGHELRNPLAPLVSTLELIRLKGSGHLAKEHAVMERQVGHLSRLVDDLLDVTRITSDKVDLQLEVFDIRTALNDAVESVAPLIDERQHRLTVDSALPAGLIKGDPERIRQVFVNLLVNAAKYTPPGGSIAVVAAHDAKTVSVSIKDNGGGIDIDLLPRVFDLFEQGATTIDRRRGGLGVGLAIVKKLMTLHGGEATAYSEGSGRGAEFTVSLPRFEPQAGSPPAPAFPQAANEVVPAVQRVLVVDDNLDALDTLAALLGLHGLEVLTASSPEQALEIAQGQQIDTFVLDIGLPGMDGRQLACALRLQDNGQSRHSRFIALTGYGQAADRALSATAGFDDHLVKPVQIEELLAVIQAGKWAVASA